MVAGGVCLAAVWQWLAVTGRGSRIGNGWLALVKRNLDEFQFISSEFASEAQSWYGYYLKIRAACRLGKNEARKYGTPQG